MTESGHFRHDRFWRGAGIAVPVFSLRTKMSVGTGEFRDMRLLIDFCEAVQFQLVQVLPVNDTSVHKMWWDSYPYSSLSVSSHGLDMWDISMSAWLSQVCAQSKCTKKNLVLKDKLKVFVPRCLLFIHCISAWMIFQV